MSLFGAMQTAISGLNAQASAVSNISGNIANSQTSGYKRLDTMFEDLVIQSGTKSAITAGVRALTRATTQVQGAIAQSDNPLSVALNGRGFFNVARPTSESPEGRLAFGSQAAFTRAGDFTLNRGGYLVNSGGYALQGWTADATGGIDSSVLRPIVVDRSNLGQPTTRVTLQAALPSAPPSPPPTMTSNVTIRDARGSERELVMTWTRIDSRTQAQIDANDPVTYRPNQWRLTVLAPGETTTTTRTVDLQFGETASTNPVPANTLGRFTNASSSLESTTYSANAAATVTATVDYGAGPQEITIDLGRFGSTAGLTQLGETEYRVTSIEQNGGPSTPFSFVSFAENGDIEANYQNGNRQVIGRVPVTTFANSDALERLDGQAFSATRESGPPLLDSPSASGAGRFVIGALESSNVDLASEFSKLIVAQRAYTGNTRVVTAADQMLSEAINIVR